MSFSEFGIKKNTVLSPYQKRVQEIDMAILCVAEAEKMIREMGLDLIADVDIPKKPCFKLVRSRTYLMCFRRQVVF
ncbi:MAG: hypothetical protein ACP5VS_05780 [Desulfomonilaceae bacterium]